jgi:UDP-glucose 4-epimerase
VKVLVTGGAGYIGSTTASALEEAGHTPVILDSLVCGPREFVGDRCFYEGDIADRALVRRIVRENPEIEATIHMAALNVVSESVAQPYAYYQENVAKSLELFGELMALGRPRVVFSSSASVYDFASSLEVFEDSPTAPSSPYARGKLMVEDILQDLSEATDMQPIVLRYFNPIGSEPQLRSGMHARVPTHVMGRLIMAARDERRSFEITGVDHPTPDGTGIRDYVHVWDVARAHVRAVEQLDDLCTQESHGNVVLNLGTGSGVSVRELVTLFEGVLGRPIRVAEAPSRAGDVVGAFANVDRAREVLGWTAQESLEDAIASTLAWFDRRADLLGYP